MNINTIITCITVPMICHLVSAKHVADDPVYCTTGGDCTCGFNHNRGNIGVSIYLRDGFHGDDHVWGCDDYSDDNAWENCCNECGQQLERVGLLRSGWWCEKDFFNTGIWLKGDKIE